jgi:integrase
MKKLTVKGLESLKREAKAYFVAVSEGLRLRIAVDGEKTWQVRFTVGGGEKTVTLSRRFGPQTDGGHLSLTDAKHEAAKIRALARDGIDYRQKIAAEREVESRAREQKKAEALTILDLFEAWFPEISVKRGKKGRGDEGKETRRSLEKDVLPFIGETLLTKICKADVLKIIRRVSDRGANRLAVMLVRDVKQMFRWGEKNQPWKRMLVEADVLAIEDSDVVRGAYDPVSDNERTRVLSPDEIRALFAKVPKSGLTTVVQRAVWIILSSGTRVGETVAARWSNVDLAERAWFIPADNTKSGTAITIALSDFTLRHFQAMWDAREHQDVEDRSDWVFPSRTDRAKPLNNQTVGKALADRQRPDGKPIMGRTEQVDALLLEGGVWKCHDLRRTAATLMQGLGIAESVAHRCLNHSQADKLSRIYLQHDYSAEMKAAWYALGDRLDMITNA